MGTKYVKQAARREEKNSTKREDKDGTKERAWRKMGQASESGEDNLNEFKMSKD